MRNFYDFPETALSVTGLTEYIKLLLEDDPQLIEVWVTEEMMKLMGKPQVNYYSLILPINLRFLSIVSESFSKPWDEFSRV